MMAVAAAALPAGPQWTYEVKWDGYRTIAVKHDGRARLISRNLKDVTQQYPAIARAVEAVRPKSATLDGEVVALDENGRPSFQALQHRTAGRIRLVFYAFDLLSVDEHDVFARPLVERRRELARVIRGSPVLLSEPLPGTPAQIERAVRGLGLEGVVAKRSDSAYEPGKRSTAWVKVKFARRQEFVIGGFKPGGADFDSILVGYYEDGALYYAGKVRAGFTPNSRAELYARLKGSPAATCPFANLPNSAGRTSHWGEGITAKEMTELRWVKPKTVVEVAFTEWTADGNLRHASFAGVREDKSAREVRRER
jgi:bifunctional non-homologous end joining protein LigD